MEGDTKREDSAEKKTGKERRMRRSLSAEKKFQLFLEAQHGDKPAAEILRREGLYSSDLTRIRQQVREGALEQLGSRPGRKPQTVPLEEYKTLKQELEEKERALADLSVELAILRKKTNGGTWER